MLQVDIPKIILPILILFKNIDSFQFFRKRNTTYLLIFALKFKYNLVMGNGNATIWNKFLGDNLEENRLGIISVVLLVTGCLGGITVGLGAIHHTWQLFLVVLPTMLTLSFLIAVGPLKTILNLAVITVIIDIIIMIINAV